MEVKFYDSVDDALLRFAVVISKVDGKWVFCKHKDRNTFEVPGGRRESGESILDTAMRELQEETGAMDFTIEPVCIYSVTGKNRVNDTGRRAQGLSSIAFLVDPKREATCIRVPGLKTVHEIISEIYRGFPNSSK